MGMENFKKGPLSGIKKFAQRAAFGAALIATPVVGNAQEVTKPGQSDTAKKPTKAERKIAEMEAQVKVVEAKKKLAKAERELHEIEHPITPSILGQEIGTP